MCATVWETIKHATKHIHGNSLRMHAQCILNSSVLCSARAVGSGRLGREGVIARTARKRS